VGVYDENKFLFDGSMTIRFISLFMICVTLFAVVWHLSYHLLPESIMQGKTGSAIIVGSDVAPAMLEIWHECGVEYLGFILNCHS